MKRNKSPSHKFTLPDNPPPNSRRRVVICIPDDDDWAAVFWGHLYKMSWWINWQRDELHRAKDVARTWHVLIEQARKAYLGIQPSPCDLDIGDCIDYPPSFVGIEYEPQNPFTQPDYVPTGYNSVPFTVVKDTDIGLLAIGFVVGDVLTDLSRFPLGSLPTIIPPDGFARFRVTVDKPSQIELNFVSVPLGGIVSIQINGDPFQVQIVNLEQTFFDTDPVLVDTSVQEFDITDESGGFIDVTFLPSLSEIPPFLRYGGALRSITICQERESGAMTFDVRQNDETPCILEKQIDGGVWEQFANLQLCQPLIRMGYDGEIEVFDPETETWTPPPLPPLTPRTGGTDGGNKCLAAKNAAIVIQYTYEELRSKYSGGLTVFALAAAAIIALSFIFISWAVLPVVLEAIALMIAVGGFAAAVFNEDDLEKTGKILYCNSSITAGVVTFDFAAVMSEMQGHSFLPVKIAGYMLPIFGEDGLNRASTTTSITDSDCSNFDCDCIAPIWIFPQEIPTWYGYNIGSGWNQDANGAYVFTNHENVNVEGSMDHTAIIPVGCTVTGMKVTLTGSISSGGYSHYEQWTGLNRSDGLGEGGITRLYGAPRSAGVLEHFKTIVGTGQTIHLNIAFSTLQTTNPPPRITRVELMYTGEMPIVTDGTPC